MATLKTSHQYALLSYFFASRVTKKTKFETAEILLFEPKFPFVTVHCVWAKRVVVWMRKSSDSTHFGPYSKAVEIFQVAFGFRPYLNFWLLEQNCVAKHKLIRLKKKKQPQWPLWTGCFVLVVSNNVIVLFFLVAEIFCNIYVCNFSWYIKYELWQSRSVFVGLCFCYRWFHCGSTIYAALGIQDNFPKGTIVCHIASHRIVSYLIGLYRIVSYRIVSFPSQRCVSSSGRLSSGGQGL